MADNVKNIPTRTSKFVDLLRAQIGHELAASQQYLAIAVWFDDRDLQRLAAHFYRQSLEERNHGMMIVQYFLDRNLPVGIPGVESVRNDFANAREPVELALQQERRVTEQFVVLARTAREEGDFLGEQFLQWFLKEQVEEEASMITLLGVIDRAEGNLFHVEDYLARESLGDSGDDFAPHAAGGAL
ncbi:ferritin [Saccharothrix australiensis]|nr:ferritin [Saccharothrix australiensis]